MTLFSKIKTLLYGSERVTDTRALKDLLLTVQKDRAVLRVKLQSARRDDTVFSTYLLRVNPRGGKRALEIDELMPRSGNALAQAQGELTVEIDHKGSQACFTVPITKFKDGFLTPMPKGVHIEQRRTLKRLGIAELGSFPVSVYSDGRNMVRGALTDVSMQGLKLRVRMDDNISPPFRQGEIIHGVHLSIGTGDEIQLHVELRSVVLKRGKRQIMLGAKIRGFKDQKHEVLFRDWIDIINAKRDE